jgi:hypothetical protein
MVKNMYFSVANFLAESFSLFLLGWASTAGLGMREGLTGWLTDWLVYSRVFFSFFVAKFFFNMAKNMYFSVANFLIIF